MGSEITVNILLRGNLVALLRGKHAGRAGSPIELSCRACQSIAHLAAILGVPRTEIGDVTVNGAEAGRDDLPEPEALIELFPVKEPVPLEGEARFVLDVHLGKLSRDLRLLGFDTLWRNDIGDGEIASETLSGGRIALTRDRPLLSRRALVRGMLVRSTDHYEQLLEVMRRYGLAGKISPFSRCTVCGGKLEPAAKSGLESALPDIVARRYDDFSACRRCGKAYWKGDHFRNIEPFLERLRNDLSGKAD